MSETLDPNPARAQADWPAAVVASAFQTGVLLARNLERRGVRVFLVDSDRSMHGFRSVYGETLACPNPDTEPEAWLAFMIELSVRAGGRPALIAASDMYVSAMGRHAAQLAPHFRFNPEPIAKLQADLALKEGQIRLATAHGLPIPRTSYVTTEAEVAGFAAAASFPCLFKPQQQRFWSGAPAGHPLHIAKVMTAGSAAELIENYRMASSLTPAVVLQEIIAGPDTNKRVHVALYRSDGERVGCCTTREFRTFPMLFGVPSVVEPVADPELEAICDRFLRAAGYIGICEIELKWDDRDGRVKMMDINPRYTGAGDAVPYAGLDHGWLHYLDLTGQTVQPVRLNGLDFRHVMLRNDIVAIRDYWRAGLLDWAAIRRTYRRPVYFWDLDFHDRRLALETLWRSLRVLLGWAWRTVRGRQSS